MNYIIIDDEPDAIDVLKYHLSNIPFMELEASFRDPVEALEYLQKHFVDLIFLDINMPKLSGISFPKLLDKPPLIIFTTAYSEYAIKSYELKAVDYLLKPIEFDRLLQAVMKAKDALNHKNVEEQASSEIIQEESERTIFIKSGSDFHQVPIQKIKYIESDGNYVTIHTTQRSILARYKLSDMIELLPQQYFARIHRSFIVAIKYISTIKTHCAIVDGIEIPVSKKYRENFLSILDGIDNK